MNPRIAVVGAGISGLSAALRLQELRPDWDVCVLEASGRAGGLIRTETIDGFLVEQGPDSILTEKPAAVALAQRLGLENELQSTNTVGRGAYVLHRGQLERIPDGFSMMAPTQALPILSSRLLSVPGKLRMLAEVLLPRGPQKADESVAQFVERRFGKEVLERLAQPLMSGIYGTDPRELSLGSTMPRFIELERRYRSVTLGMLAKRRKENEARGVRYGMFVAFKRGNQTLTDALAARLGTKLQLDSPVRSIARTAAGYRLTLEQGAALDLDAVVLAVPARVQSGMLAGLSPAASHELGQIEFGSTATVAFAWPESAVSHPLDAFGFVVPKIEQCRLIASTWASKKFAGRAPAGHVLIRVFFGGDHAEAVLAETDEALVEMGRAELERLIGVKGAPLFASVARQTRAMPRYTLGHRARVERIESALSALPGIALAGNSLYGVGIPDAILAGERAAERVCHELDTRSRP
jgi:oxygen-dependent protoporphyrinogen oxidase